MQNTRSKHLSEEQIMTMHSRTRRGPVATLWQRQPYGPLVAPHRRQQAHPARRGRGRSFDGVGLVAACGVLAMAVRWPGLQ
jgi:hypothetical protein